MFPFLQLSSVVLNCVLEFVPVRGLLNFAVVFAHKSSILKNVEILNITESIGYSDLKLVLYNQKSKIFELDDDHDRSNFDSQQLVKILNKFKKIQHISFIYSHNFYIHCSLLQLKPDHLRDILSIKLSRLLDAVDDLFLEHISQKCSNLMSLIIEKTHRETSNTFTLEMTIKLLLKCKFLTFFSFEELQYDRLKPNNHNLTIVCSYRFCLPSENSVNINKNATVHSFFQLFC